MTGLWSEGFLPLESRVSKTWARVTVRYDAFFE